MARCMPSAPQLLADIAHQNVKVRLDYIENTRLADPGVTGKGIDFPFNRVKQQVYPLSGLGTGAYGREPGPRYKYRINRRRVGYRFY